MAVMYFGLTANLPDSDSCRFALPSVDYIAFHGPKGEIVSISWSLSNDYHVKTVFMLEDLKAWKSKLKKMKMGKKNFSMIMRK